MLILSAEEADSAMHLTHALSECLRKRQYYISTINRRYEAYSDKWGVRGHAPLWQAHALGGRQLSGAQETRRDVLNFGLFVNLVV